MDKPWFVHHRRHGRWTLSPHSWQGRAITAAFGLMLVPISAILTMGGVPEIDRWIAFAALLAAALGIFVLVALRHSVPIEAAPDDGDRGWLRHWLKGGS